MYREKKKNRSTASLFTDKAQKQWGGTQQTIGLKGEHTDKPFC